ncbi:protein NETWORKED 1A-like [Zingiber officinale]|nr:protein NETWORKED 1A-like [Zingiber officinale]XP_042392331.1 protein NETWORKED 1A-like [Zingiber officinale]
METLSRAESRRLYSWWWDSHISPKLSKWLQDNLTDMDNKIKAMIRLIEEDADSFAQRAEMYYKKRPELLKLLEEFYRAYRALAERYDHVTGALRQAHRTIVKAFPNKISDEISDESLYESPAPSSRMNSHPMPPGISDTDDAGLLGDVLCLSLHDDAVKSDEAYSDESKVDSFEDIMKQLNEIFASTEDEAGPVFAKGSEGNFLDYNFLQDEISRLSMENQELKKQMYSESSRADKSENDVRCLKEICSNEKSEKQDVLVRYQESTERLTYLEHEISHAEAELKKLNSVIMTDASSLNSAEEQSFALGKANQSLRSELDILKLKIRDQKENLDRKAQELEILNVSLQNEQQRNLKAEIACQSMKQQHTDAQEEMKQMELVIESGVEKLKDVKEEFEKLREENDILRQHELSSALKIVTLQDVIVSLVDLRRKLEDENDLHIEEKEALQLELHCLINDKYDLEGKYHVLTEVIQEVNLSLQSLQVLMKDLRQRNIELEDPIKMNQTAHYPNPRNLNHMQWLSEKNVALEASLFDADDELHSLRMKMKELEESAHHLRHRISVHQAEKFALVAHKEASAQDMEKFLKKNAPLESSISDMDLELAGFAEKLEDVEELCKHFHNEKFCLISEKSDPLSQVPSIKKNLKNLECRYYELEDRCSTMEKDRDSKLHLVAELQELLQLKKEKQNTFSQSCKSQLSALKDQMHLLEEECRRREEDFDMEQIKSMNTQIEIFILQRCLCEMKDENLFLSVKCHKDVEALRNTERHILELESECLSQEQKMKYLIDNNEKIREWVQLLMQSLKLDLRYVSLEDIENGIVLQVALREIKQMVNAISDAQDEKQHLLLENSFVLTLLEHFEKYAADLRAEKTTLDEESSARFQEYMMLRNKHDEVLVMNEKLKEEIHISNQSEVTLKTETDLLVRQLMYSQEVHQALQIEVSKLVEENDLILKKLLDLSQEKLKLEEEDNVMLTEVLAMDYLSVIFKSLNSERECEITLLSNQRALLYELTINLEQNIYLLEAEITNLRVPLNNLNGCRSSQTSVEGSHSLQADHRYLKLDDCETEHLEMEKKILLDDCAALLHDNLFESINATVCKEKVLELIQSYEDLESNAILQREVVEEITLRNIPADELEKKIQVLEEENNELSADLSAHELFLGLLWDDIVVLEELTFSLTKQHSTPTNLKEEVCQLEFYPRTGSNREASPDDNASTPMRLHDLHERVKVLQEVLINTGSMIELERFDSHASLEAAWKEIEGLKLKGNQKPDKSSSKSKCKRNPKDIQLDIVFSPSSRRGNKILSRGQKDGKNSATDQTFEVWKTGYGIEKEMGRSMLLMENYTTYYQGDEEEEKCTSIELVTENDSVVDKQELPRELAPRQEWNRRVIKRLCSDAQRLSVLQANLQELHKSAETSEKINNLPPSEISSIKDQLKDADESLSQLIDVNSELKSNVENLSASPLDQIDEWDIQSRRRKQISDWARKASEKIGRLEFEMPKIEYSLCKFDKGHMNKRVRVKRRTGIRLQEYIYGRRNSRRQKEVPSCGCMMVTSTSD